MNSYLLRQSQGTELDFIDVEGWRFSSNSKTKARMVKISTSGLLTVYTDTTNCISGRGQLDNVLLKFYLYCKV